MSTTANYTVEHPTYAEAQANREARVLRVLREVITANEDELDAATAAKLFKLVNTRLLTLLAARHATS